MNQPTNPMLDELRRSLYAVPLNQTLGVVPTSLAPGDVAIELPYRPSLLDHSGALHTATLFAVAELAAGVLLATHPELAGLDLLRTSTTIRYANPCYGDVVARATVSVDAVATIAGSEGAEAVLSIAVRVHDAADNDVALVESRFGVGARADR